MRLSLLARVLYVGLYQNSSMGDDLIRYKIV